MAGSPPLVVVTRAIPGRLDIPGAEVRVGPDALRPRAEVLASLRGCAVAVTMFSDRVDDEFLDACGPGVRGVCNFAVGVDNFDLPACRRRGVAVANTPDAVTEGTADLAWTLLLALIRQLIPADRFARSPDYPRGGPLPMTRFLGGDLTGRTLLVVGAGRIGLATAMRSIGWGMRVLYVARSRHMEFELAPLAAGRVTLEEGLPLADVVTIHVPLTPATRGMFNPRTLALMKPTAVLINTARGPIVDEAALARALRDGTIAGAGLDVFEREPEIHPDLIALENVVLTPHIGSASARYRELMTEMVSANARAILEGRDPPNAVHPADHD